jgi:hypothetical protein
MSKLGMDVGFQGESGSRSDIGKLSRLTQLRHLLCTAAMALMLVSAPIKVLV